MCFFWLTWSIWREWEGVLVGKIPRGPPGGAQSTPEALRGKKFCLWKGGPNNSQCFDLPRSTIVKNTFFFQKTLKFFILIDFDEKMMYIADLDYSADANSVIIQVCWLFPAHFSPSEDNQKGCSSDWLNLGLQGPPKVPPGPMWKIFWCKNGEYCIFGIFCWCQFRNETSKMFFSCTFYSIWRQ